jgi:hypothetical protein
MRVQNIPFKSGLAVQIRPVCSSEPRRHVRGDLVVQIRPIFDSGPRRHVRVPRPIRETPPSTLGMTSTDRREHTVGLLTARTNSLPRGTAGGVKEEEEEEEAQNIRGSISTRLRALYRHQAWGGNRLPRRYPGVLRGRLDRGASRR